MLVNTELKNTTYLSVGDHTTNAPWWIQSRWPHYDIPGLKEKKTVWRDDYMYGNVTTLKECKLKMILGTLQK